MRLVDADAFDERIREGMIEVTRVTEDFEDGVFTVLEVLETQPTIQPITAHWIIDGHHIQCSHCEEYMCSTDKEGDPIPRNFCPNCGAKMEVEV